MRVSEGLVERDDGVVDGGDGADFVLGVERVHAVMAGGRDDDLITDLPIYLIVKLNLQNKI